MMDNKKGKGKKYLLIIFLLVFIIGGLFWVYRGKSTPVKNNSEQIKEPRIEMAGKDKFEGQETREVNLNFGSIYVVLTGYPYIDNEYRPRLYNLIYINTIFEPDDMVNLTDPSGKWANAFEFSATEPKIYMPIGRTEADAPIWQTMEVVSKEKAEGLLGICTATPFSLAGGLEAVAYVCQSTDATREFAGNVACFVPVEEGKGILYRQFSADGSTKADMCEVLKNNYIFSIKLKSAI